MNHIGSTSNNDRLDAIDWKCQETGLSYGQLINRYSSAEINKIYAEYREMLNARKKKGESERKFNKSSRTTQNGNDASWN